MSYPYSLDHPNVRDSSGITDSTPDEIAEIQQQDPDPSLLVKGEVAIAGTVRTQQLPSRIATSRSYEVTNTDSTPLLGADLRRKRVTLLATATATGTATGFYVGEKEDVRSGLAAFWPVNLPLVLEHTEPIYVRCATGSATCLVSVIPENWAD